MELLSEARMHGMFRKGDDDDDDDDDDNDDDDDDDDAYAHAKSLLRDL